MSPSAEEKSAVEFTRVFFDLPSDLNTALAKHALDCKKAKRVVITELLTEALQAKIGITPNAAKARNLKRSTRRNK